MKEAEEHYILQQLAGGSNEAFNELVERYWNNIYAQALAWLKSPQAAQDVTQDVFTIVWEKRTHLPAVNNFRSYLFIIARNQLATQFRNRLKQEVEADISYYEEPGLQPEAMYAQRQLSAVIEAGIRQLPHQQQRAYLLSRDEGLSYDEVAEKMQTSKEATKKNIGRALNTLRSYLRANYDALFCIVWQLTAAALEIVINF
ncbi:RNA polymerase sigma-70 factor (ECF subfamily) [Filimonas zeae]|uniref:DNA-directed RNA polymerase sigma-70 factor n=1 Tax=Filimonas zeae TaxID=1737353 RepID=A0A917MSB4_9BACT|nr:sigma-70 family RNA polymerase sigma factor [Filimonas zeae]MDR6337987.1 RNA polymerase sigma-70 factor (ECF subfamily) [Filimonas zeae]GGH61171.1 DNA-directed RNA polymerase sigma-70 factor [Filimonas zeae]